MPIARLKTWLAAEVLSAADLNAEFDNVDNAAVTTPITAASGRFADGTAAAPSFNFDQDQDTGFYRIGANNQGATAGGTLRFDWNTARLLLSASYQLGAGANTLIGAVADKLNAAHLAIASQAIGDMIQADSTTSFARAAAVADGNVWRSGGVGAISLWGKVRLSGATTDITGTLPVANGGTNSATALNNNRIIVSSAGAIVEAGAMTNGQLIIGSTGAAPVVAALTQGSGITITNAAGAITIAASGGSVVPVIISTLSRESLGVHLAAIAAAAPASNQMFGGTGNRAIYVPFTLDATVTVVKLFCYNGAIVAGNLDMAIYNESFVRQVTIGSTVASGTNVLQEFDIADTSLASGRYYLAVSGDSVTMELFASTVANEMGQAWGLANESAAFPLPATATLADFVVGFVPIIGLSLRTQVT